MIFAEPVSLLLGTVAAAGAHAEPAMNFLMKHLVLQLAIIIIAARLTGFIFQRYLRLPGVLGEVVAGILISPHAFGGISIHGIGPLFPIGDALIPISTQLYGFATVASILLLFLSGLETDLTTFLRYSVVGTAVGIGGVVFSFGLGAGCAVWFGVARSLADPHALFLGAISTATSVGITARILQETRKTDSPEGVTILAGAVIDDVLAIVVLAIVVGMAKAGAAGTVNWHDIGLISLKAVGFWIVFTVIGLLSARHITRALKFLQSMETIVSVSFGLALLMAGFMEMAGLAMIIGAYVTGLAMSRTDLAPAIQSQLAGAYNTLVPIFFCVMGMLIDLTTLRHVMLFGMVYTVIAIASKVIGCGLPAWLMKFNLLGAYRIGAGMVPRGEVALIIASIGLSSGTIHADVFGVAVMMTMLSTLLAPPLLARSFSNKSGLKTRAQTSEDEFRRTVTLDFPSPDLADFMVARLVRSFRNEEFLVYRLSHEGGDYQIRKDDMVFTLSVEGGHVTLTSQARYESVARLVVLEELLVLEDLAHACSKIRDLDHLKTDLLRGVLEDED